MKKYIANCIIAGGLFCGSIASAMDNPNDQYLRNIIASINLPVEDSIILPNFQTPTQSSYSTMNNRNIRNLPILRRNLDLQTRFAPTARISSVRTAAQEYNKNIPLITLPKELLGNMLICNSNSIIQGINAILSLSATCTHFNNKLEELGTMLQCYDQEAKKKSLKNLLENINAVNYWSKRRSALLLVYAGAEHNKCHCNYSLLEIAVRRNDLDMITTLFKYGADANLKENIGGTPIFFYSKTTEIVQLFADNGADLNTIEDFYNMNVLWNVIKEDNSSITLIQFYLDKGVDPRVLDDKRRSILHYMYSSLISDKNSEQIKIIRLLLTKIGDMINAVDNDGKTPLDLLLDDNVSKKNTISLFKEYGAKTSQELKLSELAKKEKPIVAQQNELSSCIVCWESEGTKLQTIACKNNHPDQVCSQCYDGLAKCPLCNEEFKK